ncbi:uncharacterized protein PGTG_16717 [Puccinia graminis f. sp. tritici CRL 75-36-700-3]|uniref:Uncharacterized protein n=1 Tax=Puccinia graminis f. sp. tritici (strain CRL 75-36-700-3 / race SCCL) TaxID=418459 RepID=E3L2A4_PUCGT|nr:uncharacterized protein PGTG_16717 [Puccinia graminis f. sp. tritici CRL 75-36-700-3]EFP90691.1 hypothetical protein PGTG_16717 [Puccinia graminis f. sp. tritici CRL 75-36-700-3]
MVGKTNWCIDKCTPSPFSPTHAPTPPKGAGRGVCSTTHPKKGRLACMPGLEGQEESLPAIKTVQVSMARRDSVQSLRLCKSQRPGESLPDIETVQVSMARRDSVQSLRLCKSQRPGESLPDIETVQVSMAGRDSPGL